MLWLLRHVYSNKRCFKMQDLFMYFYQDNSDLWIVLHVWVRKKIRKNIYKNTGWHSAFLKALFTNRWFAPVPLITPWLRAKMPAATVRQSTTGRCEFVKNAFKKCSCCHPFFLEIVLLIFFLTHTWPTLPLQIRIV